MLQVTDLSLSFNLVTATREYKSLLKRLRTSLQKKQRNVRSVKAINVVINVKQCSLFTTDVRYVAETDNDEGETIAGNYERQNCTQPEAQLDLLMDF